MLPKYDIRSQGQGSRSAVAALCSWLGTMEVAALIPWLPCYDWTLDYELRQNHPPLSCLSQGVCHGNRTKLRGMTNNLELSFITSVCSGESKVWLLCCEHLLTNSEVFCLLWDFRSFVWRIWFLQHVGFSCLQPVRFFSCGNRRAIPGVYHWREPECLFCLSLQLFHYRSLVLLAIWLAHLLNHQWNRCYGCEHLWSYPP